MFDGGGPFAALSAGSPELNEMRRIRNAIAHRSVAYATLDRRGGGRTMTHESIQPKEGVMDKEPRCWRCGRKLAEKVTRPWEICCDRYKARNGARWDGTPFVSRSS